jgi:uncharacterized protein
MSELTYAQQSIPAMAGIGLRAEHYELIATEKPKCGWFEVHTENYFGNGGIPHHYLHRIRKDYPISFHGVGLSLGSVDPVNTKHLQRIKQLIAEYQPGLISEHLSWSSFNGVFTNDLLPFPLTTESFNHFKDRVNSVQDFLEVSILVENPSTYLRFKHDEIPETDFLNDLAKQTGCGLLLDVNNVFVCATNHDFSAAEYIDNINIEHVKEIHLAGHTKNHFENGSILIDTHNTVVDDLVWSLYQCAIKRTGQIATLIEWDTDLPEFEILLNEASKAQNILDQVNVAAA